jgi:hypothetical protein
VLVVCAAMIGKILDTSEISEFSWQCAPNGRHAPMHDFHTAFPFSSPFHLRINFDRGPLNLLQAVSEMGLMQMEGGELAEWVTNSLIFTQSSITPVTRPQIHKYACMNLATRGQYSRFIQLCIRTHIDMWVDCWFCYDVQIGKIWFKSRSSTEPLCWLYPKVVWTVGPSLEECVVAKLGKTRQVAR